MMRILFIALVCLMIALILLKVRISEEQKELPIFLQHDQIATDHRTHIDVFCESVYTPDDFQLALLKQDYSNIWAHLNHLYNTNEVEIGKEYYTENWFSQINRHHDGPLPSPVIRKDLHHELHIKNWASDALVCTAVDSNVILQFSNSGLIRTCKYHVAVVLLFQGDHWRIDALSWLGGTEQ